MQAELDAASPAVPIHLFGVNMPGNEAGVPDMILGNTIGLLQDTVTDDVSTQWGVTYRDVYLLDQNNQVVEVYNLTTYNLDDPANYAYLRDRLLAIANGP